MYEQVEKTKENKSRAIGNSVAQMKNSGKQGLGFVDNREEAVAQRKLHMMAQDYSPRQVVQMNPINGEPRTVTVCDENQKPLCNFQEGCSGEFNYKKGDKILPGTTTDGKKATWDKFCISGNTTAYQLHIVNAKWGGDGGC